MIYHSHRGGDEGTTALAAAKTDSHFERAFEAVQPTLPPPANASTDEPDPEYLLVLGPGVEERGQWNAYFHGLTLGVVPLYLRSDVIVGATLQSPAGENPISHRSMTEVRGIAQILLVLALPWTLTHPLGEEIYLEPMRTAVGAVATDLAHLRSGAPSELPASAASRQSTD